MSAIHRGSRIYPIASGCRTQGAPYEFVDILAIKVARAVTARCVDAARMTTASGYPLHPRVQVREFWRSGYAPRRANDCRAWRSTRDRNIVFDPVLSHGDLSTDAVLRPAVGRV